MSDLVGGQVVDAAAPGVVPMRAALALSAARCVLTYLVVPLLSPIGFLAELAGPIGVWLQLLAIGSVAYGTTQMWRGHRRGRVAYSGLAVLITFVSIAGIARALA